MTVGKTFLVATVLAVACLYSPTVALAGGNGSAPVPDPALCPGHMGDFWFSTEVGFTSGAFPPAIFPVSDGDLLWEHRPWRIRNQRLTQRLGIMPVVPDLGLDAVTFPHLHNPTPAPMAVGSAVAAVKYRDIWFSTEEPVWSETLGLLSDGDLLSARGRIVRTNAQLIAAFEPGPVPIDGVGLDAVHTRLRLTPSDRPDVTPIGNGGIYFSSETNFWSRSLNRLVGHGDLLRQNGTIHRTNAQLLRNFRPCPTPIDIGGTQPPERDYGLDAVYVARNGRILFSLEDDFCDRYWGIIDDGDLLCECGHVVRRNRDLMDVWQPLEDLDDFGLDAIELISRSVTPWPIDEIEVEPTPAGGG